MYILYNYFNVWFRPKSKLSKMFIELLKTFFVLLELF